MSWKSSQTGSVRSLDRSNRLLQQAQNMIPECSQTNSKGPTQWVQGVAPTHLERGKGSHVWDVDGNEYVDYPMALGPIILGHNYPAVTNAVEQQLRDGTMFSMPHPLQLAVAEQLIDVVPCAEMVRFGKNGSDVTTLAAKLARAYTGREIIATQGYHGWPDVWMGQTSLDRGIPDVVGDLTESFEYNDIESLEQIFTAHPGDVAAIVTTPVNLAEPEDDFVQRMREIADREGAVLIFDEILTGFRFAVGGAQEYFGVTPDVACFAKGMANGFPISAVAGRRDVMQTIEADDVFYSMTYAGDALSLAAANACLSVIREENVTDHIFEQGQTLQRGYNDLAAAYGLDHRTECVGYPPRFSAQFSDETGKPDRLAKSLFMQECLERGVLFSGNHLLSYSHTDSDIDHTLDVYETAMETVADAIDADDIDDRLDGEPIGATLRQRTGEDG
ncbi:aminotransferase class III-fold pyridoxal phosphate-dependent enzyme [Halocatena marina]|uniref:Glutamate-1-semialdehyde 2,1-aminomutase n=1 Tax=Halocatena marina TaxID=2934937 RepID=A0ABD5YKM9_9EURY|nr:aminotransferase class III-fold pyridoxal phosphate-dependent enzyme [Halocatena marina]